MEDASVLDMLPRLFGSMAVVLIAMALAARFFKGRQIPGAGGLRFNPSKTPTARKKNLIEVKARQSLGRHSGLAVVQVGDQTLLLGITDQNVTVLTQFDDPDAVEEVLPDIHGTDIAVEDLQELQGATSSTAWTGLLEQVRERTVRR